MYSKTQAPSCKDLFPSCYCKQSHEDLGAPNWFRTEARTWTTRLGNPALPTEQTVAAAHVKQTPAYHHHTG